MKDCSIYSHDFDSNFPMCQMYIIIYKATVLKNKMRWGNLGLVDRDFFFLIIYFLASDKTRHLATYTGLL